MSEEKKQRLKEYQKIFVRLKIIFHRYKKPINILSKKIHIVLKVHFKIAITKIFFISASGNNER